MHEVSVDGEIVCAVWRGSQAAWISWIIPVLLSIPTGLVYGWKPIARAIADQVTTLRNRIHTKGEQYDMKIPKNSLVLTAAFAGLLGGTMTRLNAGSNAWGSSDRRKERKPRWC